MSSTQPPPPPLLEAPPPTSIVLCSNDCYAAPKFASDSYCDDGGPDSAFSNCDLGTDCEDCGPRVRVVSSPVTRRPSMPSIPTPKDFVQVTDNPFHNPFHTSLQWRLQLLQAMNGTYGATRDALLQAWNTPVGFWVESAKDIHREYYSPTDASQSVAAHSAEGILQDAASQPHRPLVVLVLHLPPDRDCHGASTVTEFCCQYRDANETNRVCSQFSSAQAAVCTGMGESLAMIDALVSLLSEYHSLVPIAIVVEPRWVSGLALRHKYPACQHPSTLGVAYAVRQIKMHASSVALYLSAGNGQEMGWDERADSFVAYVVQLGNLVQQLRGFATNIGGYQASL